MGEKVLPAEEKGACYGAALHAQELLQPVNACAQATELVILYVACQLTLWPMQIADRTARLPGMCRMQCASSPSEGWKPEAMGGASCSACSGACEGGVGAGGEIPNIFSAGRHAGACGV